MRMSIRNITAVFCLLATGGTFAQGDFGSDPEQCKMNISLYQDAMSRNEFTEAYKPWQKILELCPAWSKGVYQNGIKIMSALIQVETDPTRKQVLVDSLYMVHDMRAQYFGEESFVQGRKGLDMLVYEPAKCEEAYAILKQAVDLGGAAAEPSTLSGRYQALNCMYAKGEATKEQMLSDFVVVNGHLENAMSSPNVKEADRDYYAKAREMVNSIFFKVAECSDIGRIVDEMVAANPDDNELKTRLLKVLNTKDCTDEKVYRPLAESVHRADPSSESAYSLGMMLVRNNEMANAMKYMKEAVDLCTDCPDKTKYLLKAGQVASASGNHAQSKAFANQLLQIDPRNGEAYLLIGNAVASQAGSCEGKDAWGVYWLAYDYYQRARTNDPNVSDKARDRMAASEGRFPTSGEAFFHQLSEGQSFQVTCGGLNESTTVRTRKN